MDDPQKAMYKGGIPFTPLWKYQPHNLSMFLLLLGLLGDQSNDLYSNKSLPG